MTDIQKPKKLSLSIILLISSVVLGMFNFILANQTTLHPIKIVTLIFTYGIMAFFIYFINARKNWARITFLILFIIGSIMFPFTLPAAFELNPVVGVISIILTLLQAVALILMFSKVVNQWFNLKKTSL